ncbi:MAG: hypothetical protein WKF63_02615, partial [Thermomicrobiales bacterium]
MDEHAFDRWTSIVAHHRNRRLVSGGLLGGLLAGVLGVRGGTANLTRRTQTEGDCSLGCTSSTCGEIAVDCPLFPTDNICNTPIDSLPVDAQSDAYVASIGADTGMHADIGSGLYEGSPLGIPFVRVPANQPAVEVTFEVADESDPGPYPIPLDAPIEGGSCGTGDRL